MTNRDFFTPSSPTHSPSLLQVPQDSPACNSVTMHPSNTKDKRVIIGTTSRLRILQRDKSTWRRPAAILDPEDILTPPARPQGEDHVVKVLLRFFAATLRE